MSVLTRGRKNSVAWVFVGYEAVILRKILYGLKNIFENVIRYCLIRWGR